MPEHKNDPPSISDREETVADTLRRVALFADDIAALGLTVRIDISVTITAPSDE